MTKAKPKRPDTIFVSPFDITIEVDPTLVEKHSVVGHWAGDSQRITVDGNLPRCRKLTPSYTKRSMLCGHRHCSTVHIQQTRKRKSSGPSPSVDRPVTGQP